MAGNKNKTHLFNGATYRDARPVGLSRLFYIDLWYAQFIDPKAGIEFFVNICLNNPYNVKLGDLIGMGRSIDVITCVWDNGEQRIEPLHYFYDFSTQSKIQDLDIGHGTIQMNVAAVPSASPPGPPEPIMHLKGREDSIRVEYDLRYQRLTPPCQPTIHDYGARVRNALWDYPFMPRARVTGTVIIDGKARDIDTQSGYSDSMWGSTTVWYYNPWVIIQSEEVVILAWASGARRKRNRASVYAGGGWHDVKNPSFETLETATSSNYGFKYPTRQRIVGTTGDIDLDVTVSELHGGFFFNVGTERLIVPAMRSLSYVADGRVTVGEMSHEIKGAPTSFDVWNCLDFLNLVLA